MSVVLDAAALIALERRPGAVLAQMDKLAFEGELPVIPATVLAQVWRSGTGMQSRLAALLPACDVDTLDAERARAVGRLLAASATTDVVDAHVVVAASADDVILTSDPIDIAVLALAANKQVRIAQV